MLHYHKTDKVSWHREWNLFFFRVAFSSSCLLAHSTPFSRSTKSRSIILVQLWLWYRTIQHNSNFLLDFWSHENLVPYLSGGFDWSHHKLYVYSEDFSFIGSLPWLRAKIVEEFTRAVSCMCANITMVHFIDFVLSCEISCAGQQYLYYPLWNHAAYTIPICSNYHLLWYPWSAQELTTWGYSFFPLMTSQHTRTKIKGHLFTNKSRWTMLPFPLHPLFQ